MLELYPFDWSRPLKRAVPRVRNPVSVSRTVTMSSVEIGFGPLFQFILFDDVPAWISSRLDAV